MRGEVALVFVVFAEELNKDASRVFLSPVFYSHD